MPLGKNLRKLRIQNRMTLEEVAAIIGTTKQTVQKYECGVIANIPHEKIEQLAEVYGVSPSALMGWDRQEIQTYPVEEGVRIPVVASVAAGYNGLAEEEFQGYETVYDIKNTSNCVWLRVTGDSMAPTILEGDFALVRRQPDVDSGDIAVVIYDGGNGTVKKVQKHSNAVSLVPFNPQYETMVIIGEDLQNLMIYGKVIEIKRRL